MPLYQDMRGSNDMKIDINRRELFKPIIENKINELQKDDVLLTILEEYGEEDYKQALRVSVYDDIQGTLDGRNLLTVINNGTREDLVKLLWSQHRDINILETEIYNIKNGGQDEVANAFYGNISNEKIELFEMIEEYI